MGWRAIIALVGCGIAAAGLMPGCAALQRSEPMAAGSPEQLRQRRALSHAAQLAMDRDDWPEAQRFLQQLAAIEPLSAEVDQRLGQVWEAQGQLERAEQSYRKALKNDPEYPAALVGLGRVEFHRGRLKAALDHLERAIELDPRRTEAHQIRAEVLEALGRPEEALAAYFRALQFDPTSAPMMRQVALLQLAGGRSEQALARLDQVIELTPDDPEARLLRGRTRLALGEPRRAIDDLRAASRQLPDNPEVFYELARALAAAGPEQLDDARHAAERAVSLAPDWSEAGELHRQLRR